MNAACGGWRVAGEVALPASVRALFAASLLPTYTVHAVGHAGSTPVSRASRDS